MLRHASTLSVTNLDPRGHDARSMDWIAHLDVNLTPQHVRKTSIICTIGPATNSVQMMNKLREAGMNVVRMNFSHGTYEYHASVIKNCRQSQQELAHRSVAIALDTKGPEIRTGVMKDNVDVPIQAGHEMEFTTDPEFKDQCTGEVMYIDYENFAKVIRPGKYVYVDDGIITFEVTSVNGNRVHVKALNSGTLSSRKGVNLPGTNVDLPALSAKDIQDLQWGVEQGVDMVFASFVRSADNVREIRKVLGEKGKNIRIISKIENHQGVANFPEILQASDGIMVARGDLGIEIEQTRVFIAQKAMIAQCNLAGKPVICATQMLESMTTNPRPTRAEVSDVANAVLDGADCVMLSGETAKGKYPIEVVKTMHHVCLLAESSICYPPLYRDIRALTMKPTDHTETIACSAVNAAIEHEAGAIIVLTTSGNSARLISKYRPRVPIIAVTRNAMVARQIHLHRGCYPLCYDKGRVEPWQEDVEARVRFAVNEGVKYGLLTRGSSIIVCQGWQAGSGYTNTMRVLIAM